ncbi:hypothetical protein KsCSTR_03410 [Candidatus Kuenenia stuttgartiensis]|uniref:Uncharacterized protein n=1 Tax=Kuenenia stuttgartiensis TaxID=174633 RepID=A0A6G7GJB9_KUEST|nr:hypothetical protein KsCSTR_03410 [Candidatus Kuenenia stuttgartiensis]
MASKEIRFLLVEVGLTLKYLKRFTLMLREVKEWRKNSPQSANCR